ncbi:MAG: hypothetical protein ACI8W8_002443 [Rhodothermales bacterium]|jgi:hypothetical protein
MKFLFFLLLLSVLTGCANPDEVDSITPEELKKQPAPAGPSLLPVKMRQGVSLGSLKLDAYFIEQVKLQSDELQLECAYGGGCETHDLDLLATRYVFDATTAVVDLIVTHDSHNDACEAFLSSTHRFDLTPIKKAYAESAAAPAGLAITLRLFDFKADKPVKILTYK